MKTNKWNIKQGEYRKDWQKEIKIDKCACRTDSVGATLVVANIWQGTPIQMVLAQTKYLEAGINLNTAPRRPQTAQFVDATPKEKCSRWKKEFYLKTA